MKQLSGNQRQEYLEKMRKKLKDKNSKGYKRDPNEFRIPKAKDGEGGDVNLYFKVLPELAEGDECEGGVSTRDYDFFFYEQGGHWLDNRKYECPRVHDGDDCPVCQLAFELLGDTTDDAERKAIISKYLPRTYYAINAYFLDIQKNPGEVRGKTLWLSVPKTIFNMFDACLHSENEGDSDDPKAFGLFYDPMEGYTFKLVAKKKGEWNNYDASKFLPKTISPLVKNDDDSPNEEAINEILNQRHDLATKFDDRDFDKLKSIVNNLVSGGDNWDEPKQEPKKASKPKPDPDDEIEEKPKKKAKAKVEKKEPEPEAKADDSDDSDDLGAGIDDEALNALIGDIEDE